MTNPPPDWEEMERRAAAQAREYYRQAGGPRPPPARRQPPQGRRPLLGRFTADQALLAALLCLLVQEDADPQLILAVAYILIG